ncbi:MAG: lysylphosphatidylglycerol synthase transmembrane domain-containing protein, partial [Candidatus Omnitrophica bacterium]|nr:lysylphosphatidylglycerol synthase transmembrane domain-containing protein [Candidatus Omnitrophota bacterium]
LIFRTQEISISYLESLYLAFMGLFFNLFFPSAIGGDVAKAYYAYKHTGKKIESMSSVFSDRLIGFIAIIIMALVALGVASKQFDDPRVYQIIFVFLGIMIFSVLFFASKRFAGIFGFLQVLIPSEKLKHRLGELYHAIYGFKHHKGMLVASLLISAVAQTFFILVHYFLARGLGVQIGMSVFFLLVPVVAIVSMAPSVGGLGVREAGMIIFFKKFMLSERALALSILLDMLVYGVSLIAGIFYAFHGGLKKKEIHEMEELES